MNATLGSVGRALLLPHKFWQVRADKRSPAADKTVKAAWRKTQTALESALKMDSSIARNDRIFFGSATCVLGMFLAVVIRGMEFIPIVGAGLMYSGGSGSGLQPQPELIALGVICVLALICGDSAKPSSPKSAKRKKAQ